MTQYEPEWLLFAGDATWGIIWGVGFLAFALFAGLRDRRRAKRASADAVGCMPWTFLSVIAVFAAAAAFLFALKS